MDGDLLHLPADEEPAHRLEPSLGFCGSLEDLPQVAHMDQRRGCDRFIRLWVRIHDANASIRPACFPSSTHPTGSWSDARSATGDAESDTGHGQERACRAGRTGIPIAADSPALPLIPRSSVFLQEAGGALRNLHTNSSRKSSDQQVGKFIRPPLWHKESRHQDQRIGDPEPHGVFTVS